MNSEALVAIVVSSLVLGSLYALMASGLALVYATLRVFNFAHGALLTVGAYVAWTMTEWLSSTLGQVLAATVAVLTVMVACVPFERLFIRPFISRRDGPILVAVATIATAALIENVVQEVWGPQLKQLPEISGFSLTFAGSTIGASQMAAVVLAPALLIALALLLKRTQMGLAIRGVQQNVDHAKLVGVRTTFVYQLVFALAGGLAACTGILLGSIFFVTPTMGGDPLLKAFVVVVFGGLCSLSGTILGAFVIGAIEAVSAYFLGLYWSPVIVFGAMVAIMLIRPEGLVVRRRLQL